MGWANSAPFLWRTPVGRSYNGLDKICKIQNKRFNNLPGLKWRKNGCGFIFTRAKGGQDRLRVNFPEGEEFIVFHNKYVRNYKNKDMYPVCILGECIHAKIDVALLNIFKYLKNIFPKIKYMIQKLLNIIISQQKRVLKNYSTKK